MFTLAKDIEISLENAAHRFGIALHILVGMAMTESSGQWGLTRHEPAYRYLWDIRENKPFRKLTSAEAHSATPPEDFPAPENSTALEEWENQRTSFGVLQVMGAVARELGYIGDLNDLRYHDGIVMGARHFKDLYKRFFADQGIEGVVEAYNRGRPDPDSTTPYAHKVLTFATQYQNHVQG